MIDCMLNWGSRDALLSDIILALVNDERYTAAWLTGSDGRGTADAVSDIDLTVLIPGP